MSYPRKSDKDPVRRRHRNLNERFQSRAGRLQAVWRWSRLYSRRHKVDILRPFDVVENRGYVSISLIFFNRRHCSDADLGHGDYLDGIACASGNRRKLKSFT